MRIVFMGTPDFSVPALEALAGDGHDILAVYTQPARAAGRGQKPRPSPVAVCAERMGLAIRTPESMRKSGEIDALEDLAADCIVVVAYGQILPERALKAARFGALNIHASLLPRWRGAAPIQRAIMAGDTRTGVCIMAMEKGLDTGPVMLSETIPIDEHTTAGDLHDRLSHLGGRLIRTALRQVADGSARFIAQDEERVTYAHKIDKAEARVDWSRPARDVLAHIHGLSPFPGAWTEYKDTRLKLVHARLDAGAGVPGTVLDERLLIACGDGAIRLESVQKPGRGVLDRDAFLRGFPVKPGDRMI